MNKFKDFGVKPDIKNFIGDKIPVKRIINVPIIVHDYKIDPSTQKEGTECLTLQIEKSGEKRVVFTGSTVLIQMIRKIPKEKFPSETTIKNDSEYYEFT